MPDELSALDAAFLELEQIDPGALMNIGALLVFEPEDGSHAPTLEEVCETVRERLGGLPRYSQRLSSPKVGGISRPHWEDYELFRVEDHISRQGLPAPGADAELCDWTAEFFSHPLDRSRPLWEMVVLEGLAGGRWGLGIKLHHCMVDGVGSAQILDRLFSYAQGGEGARPRPPHVSPQPAHVNPLRRVAGTAREVAGATQKLTELLISDEIIGAPHTSLGEPIGQARRFAAVRMPLEEVKEIGRAIGGSVNDVALAACAGGLRRLLSARKEELPDQGVRAMVPVDLRTPADASAQGNRVSSLFVDLPVAEPDPVVRLRTIIRTTNRLKVTGAARGAGALLGMAALAPPAVMGAVLSRKELTDRLFNLTITNVRGSAEPLFAWGSRLRDVYPIVPLAADHTVGIAVFSYNGVLTFGINADSSRTPDLGVLAYGIESALEELHELVAASSAATTTTRRTTT